jgi:alpha-mannosidase
MSAPTHDPLDVLTISHTHWDREWYLPAGRFRQRLVALIDDLLDRPPEAGATFLLDGQAVVLEDYLAVRPERRAELSDLLRTGVLEAGPWFVLADELIPGGEALVRNLLAGRRVLRSLRAASPPVLYSPDAFGHPAMLPALAAGFGLPVILLWRGLGGARFGASRDWLWWRAPSGERALVYHLTPSGYELGASLPSDDAHARDRWQRIRAQFTGRTELGVVLLPNGADHHARQPDVADAIAALARAALPDRVRAASLSDAAAEGMRRAAPASLPEIGGELRDSYGYTWTLQGTFATRAHQKRRNAFVERLLVRDAEPWAALAARHTARGFRHLLAAAWRDVLLCHPHDTLCGCSIDEVARAADARSDNAMAQGLGIREDALLDLLGHDRVSARDRRAEWTPVMVVRNPAARARGGVAEVEVLTFQRDVPVGPESAAGGVVARHVARGGMHIDGVTVVQLLGASLRDDRTESPQHYPDNDLVKATRAVVWIDPVPGYGVRAYPITSRRRAPQDATPVSHPVVVSGTSLANGRLQCEVDASGHILLRSMGSSWSAPRVVRVEDADDSGDLYTSSIRGAPRVCEQVSRARVTHRGPLRGRVDATMRVPAAGAARSSLVHVGLELDADAPFLRIHAYGTNTARDHRLRVVIATGLAGAAVHADAAFGPVRREAIDVPDAERAVETPPATAPLQRYVTLSSGERGVTIFSDGLAEYEALENGDVAITLCRSVGELSRADLPERPGHAGWPAATPDAQCLGPFAGMFAVMPHGARTPETIDAIERVADDVLVPLVGSTLRSALAVPPPAGGIELRGPGLAFSCAKESEDGEWLVVRCVNLTDGAVEGAWRVGFAVREAGVARLDETIVASCEVTGDGTVPFIAVPRAMVTILVR